MYGQVYIDFIVNRMIGPGQPRICSPKQSSKLRLEAPRCPARHWDVDVTLRGIDSLLIVRLCIANTVFTSTTILLPSYRPRFTTLHADCNSSRTVVINASLSIIQWHTR